MLPLVKRLPFFILTCTLFLFLSSCNDEEELEPAPEAEVELTSEEAFFETMRTFCGEEFYGETTYIIDPDDEMADAELYIHVAECDENEIRIPFHVDDNTSRTWILTMDDEGLLFKHDHRHEDGRPEDITNYGGYADHRGNAHRQYFPADEETAEMIPEAESNVWMIEVDLEEMKLIYDLQRHNEPRYRAEFVLMEEVPGQEQY